MKESSEDPHALKVTSQEDMLKKLRHSEVTLCYIGCILV